MTCRGKTAVGLVVAAVLLLTGCAVAWSAILVKDGDPYTIGEALSKPDGSVVTLTCEQVLWRGKSGQSFAVKEWFEKSPQQPRLVVVSTSSLPVESYWSLDITGTIETFTASLPTGATYKQRVVVVAPESVQVYCDSKGKPNPFPIFKGFTESWITKRPLLISSSDTAETVGQLPVLPDTPDAPPPTPGSRDSVKILPDGARVSVNGAVVSCSLDGRFAIERSDRSYGIWMNYPSRIPKRALVDITGHMNTAGGIRIVVADSVNILDTEYPEEPLFGVNNRNLNYGLDTAGMTVRVWGVVTDVDTQNRIFFIDDGSNLDGGSGHVGVQIVDVTQDTLPSVDDYVAVNGASGVDENGIRTVYKTESGTTTYASLSMLMEGTGTISGTITAAGADGSSVRVYCDKAYTTATFSGGTASYTLRVPYGSYAVTTSATGYKTTTKLVRVNSGTPNPQYDVVLPAIGKVIDIVCFPSGFLADGTQETVVTAIFRDEEGRRFANVPITWSLAGAALFSGDTTTDAVGEAKAIVRHDATTGSASVTVVTGTFSSQCAIN